MKTIHITLSILCATFIFSCKDKEAPLIPNEEELITTLSYTLTNDSTSATSVFTFTDLDGDGGNSPVLVLDSLESNSSYSGQIGLLNETEDPAENILLEVLEEELDHQFFYSTTASEVNIDYTDFDANGNPIGASTKLITGSVGSGSLIITLRHQPDKSATGVSDGDITNAGGESDIEVTFPVVIQ